MTQAQNSRDQDLLLASLNFEYGELPAWVHNATSKYFSHKRPPGKDLEHEHWLSLQQDELVKKKQQHKMSHKYEQQRWELYKSAKPNIAAAEKQWIKDKQNYSKTTNLPRPMMFTVTNASNSKTGEPCNRLDEADALANQNMKEMQALGIN